MVRVRGPGARALGKQADAYKGSVFMAFYAHWPSVSYPQPLDVLEANKFKSNTYPREIFFYLLLC